MDNRHGFAEGEEILQPRRRGGIPIRTHFSGLFPVAPHRGLHRRALPEKVSTSVTNMLVAPWRGRREVLGGVGWGGEGEIGYVHTARASVRPPCRLFPVQHMQDAGGTGSMASTTPRAQREASQLALRARRTRREPRWLQDARDVPAEATYQEPSATPAKVTPAGPPLVGARSALLRVRGQCVLTSVRSSRVLVPRTAPTQCRWPAIC